MGCSLKSISDDEDDWYAFRKTAEVPLEIKIDMYSEEARAIKQMHEQFGFKGDLLLRALELRKEQWALNEAKAREQKERELYLKLKAKFEK